MERQAIVSFALAFAAAVVLAVWQQGRRESRRLAGPSAHGVAAGFLVLLASAPVTWAWFLILGDQRLPVERPTTPGGIGCSDSDPFDALTVVILLGLFYLIARGIPFVIGFAVGYLRNRRERRALPDGHLALRATGYTLAAVSLIAVVRVAIGGAAPTDYTTYGALTAEGARGWRADRAIGRAADGAFEPMVDGPPAAGGDASGAHIWVGSAAMLVEVADGRPPYLRAVARGDEYPPERRAHFEGRPEVAPTHHGWLLAERRADGSRFAVVVATDGGERAATVREAGPLLAAPLWPLLAALPLVGVVAFLARAPGDPDRPLRYLASSWMLVEAAILLFSAYRPYI